MSVSFVKGDLFESEADVLVNATNVVGIMGGGIALEFKRRFPLYFENYAERCKTGEEKIGSVGVHDLYKDGPIIVNLHTKFDLTHSRYAYVILGLVDLRYQLETKLKGKSIAMPALGCGLGGLDWKRVSALIRNQLGDLPNDIKVYEPQ